METFEKKLVGRDEVAINQKLDLWQDATGQLNDLSRNWDEYFSEPFTPELVAGVLRTKPTEHFIQVHFIHNDKELAKLAEAQRVKMQKLIEITDFPNYEFLKNSINAFKDWLVRKSFQDELEDNIVKLYIDGEYVFPDEMKAVIEAKHTYYTRDIYENAALELVQNVCDSLNALNDLGLSVFSSDLPIAIQQCVSDVEGTKTYSELQSGQRDGKFFISRLSPFWGMFKRENNDLLNQIRKNLKFQ